MKYIAKTYNKIYEVELNGSAENLKIRLDGKKKRADLKRIGEGGLYSLIVDNHSYQLFIQPKSGGYEVTLDGRKYFVALEDEKTTKFRSLLRADEKAKGQIEIKAPMPGLIVKIEVKEGQEIKKGDGLVIVEAMKMENEIRTSHSGVVKKVFLKEKELVEKNTVLMIIE